MPTVSAMRLAIIGNIEREHGPVRRAGGGAQTYIDSAGRCHIVRTRDDFQKPDFDQYWWDLTPAARAEGDFFYFAVGSHGYLHFTSAELELIVDGFHTDGTRPSAIVYPVTKQCLVYVHGHLQDLTSHLRSY